MTRVRDFVADLASAGKSFTEKKKWKLPTGTRACLLLRYRIIKHLNLKKTIRTANTIASVTAAVADDRQIDTRSLPATHGA
jgi:hypothetical protein